MLRLRSRVLAHLLSSPVASPASHLRRLISAAAPAVSPNHGSFAVEEYLVETCGLTRAQATKASGKISHLKSPAKPDAVLAFLAGLGLSTTDVASVVAREPLLLCAKVEKTLAPKVAGLAGLGLSRSEIARIAFLAGDRLRRRNIVSKLQYYLPLFGSPDNLIRVLQKNSSLLSSDLERVVKPNLAYLQECGLGACDIAKLYTHGPSPLSISTERLRAGVACIEGLLGVPRGSPMFRHALQAVAFLSEEKITAKVKFLKEAFMWTDAEVGIAVSKAPSLLARSEESLRRRSEFFTSEAGFEPAYTAHRSVMLTLSLEGRLRPRYYAVEFLKENGLLKHDRSFSTIFTLSEKTFRKKFICPYMEALPHLAEDYDAACKGEMPTNFKSTQAKNGL